MYIKIGGPLVAVVILYFVFFSGGSGVVADTITIAPREFFRNSQLLVMSKQVRQQI